MSLYTFDFTPHLFNICYIGYLNIKCMPIGLFSINNEFTYLSFSIFVDDIIILIVWRFLIYIFLILFLKLHLETFR